MADEADMGLSADAVRQLLAANILPELQKQTVNLEAMLTEATALREGLVEQAEAGAVALVAPMEDTLAALADARERFDEVLPKVEPWWTSFIADTTGRAEQISDQCESADGQFDAAAARCVEVEAQAAGRVEEAEDKLNDLLLQMEGAIADVRSAVDQFEAALNEHQAEFAGAISDLFEALDKFQHAVESNFHNVQQNAEARADETREVISTILDEGIAAVEGFSSSTSDILGEVRDAADKLNKLFGEDAKQLIENVDELLQLMEALEPLLEWVNK